MAGASGIRQVIGRELERVLHVWLWQLDHRNWKSLVWSIGLRFQNCKKTSSVCPMEDWQGSQ